jgi:hypothetical protein
MEMAENTRLADFSVLRKGEIAADQAERGPSKEKCSLWDRRRAAGSILHTAGESIMKNPCLME